MGHRAAPKSKPDASQFTHDWTLFVRGQEGCNIQHFIERVVFYLHESFPKPRRGKVFIYFFLYMCCKWNVFALSVELVTCIFI